jgi:E3 ubiquitin-protein ligase SHPRH
VFSLWNSSTPNSGVDVVATAPTDVVDCIVPHLETMQSLCTTNKGKKRSAKLGASFCRSLLLPPVNEQDVFRLECEIRWLVGVSVVEVLGAKTPYGRRDMDLLSRYVPAESRKAETPWVLSDFYDSVHVPLEAIEPSSEIKNSLPNTSLYPFQQRAVDWLLRRERAAYKVNGDLGDLEDSRVNSLISFKPRKDLAGKTYFVSHLRGLIICDPKTVTDLSQMLCGGILAEEMGLGKTVELIALMSLHRRVLSEGDVYDQYTNTMVKPSGATLIITPPSILEQWKSEINSHSLSLRVYHYQGIPSPNAPQKQQNAATVENLMKYDVVLTTYNVLSREVHFANPPPDRALRNEKQHQFRKSPLVQISWWRVCLDEAQMVENGVSQAATVARIIPRCNAWAVSGTPLRKDVQDLRGLLTFLRYRPFADQAVWSRLDKLTFRTIFNQIALRHTKDKIRGELQLPPQKRVVITVPFTAIEEQNYTDMIRQMCTACFLDSEGLSVRDDRDANHPEVIDRMREWLVRLRQTCLHANVGRKNRKALGAKNGPLRTIHEVLEVMIEQNDANMKGEARESILAQIRCGHIRGNAGDDDNRSEHARPFYERALQDAQAYVKICREELALEQKRLGKTDMDEEKDLEDEEKEEHNIGQIPVIRKSLRTFLGLEHACKFFLGTVFFQIKSNEKLTKPASEQFYSLEKLEAQWYEAAKKVRKELLRHIQNKAQKQMEKIQAKKPFHQIPVIEDLPDLGGIEGKKMLDMMDDISDNLNAQAKQLDKWRLKVGGILLLRLVDAEEEKEISLTGEEYEDSTKAQDELYVYIMALRTLVADRSAVVGGFKDPLTEHEMKEAVKKTFEKEEEKRGHAPELVREVAHTRDKLKPTEEMGSLKLVVSAARSLLNGLQWKADEGDIRATAELSIVRKQLTKIQQIFADQEQCLKELEHEQELFRITMNQRLEFYRQLQHISDTVAPWKEVLDPAFDSREFNRQEQLEKQSKRRVTGLKNKNNYLVNLRTENEQSNVKHECIICIMEFELGVLTTCGHKVCGKRT